MQEARARSGHLGLYIILVKFGTKLFPFFLKFLKSIPFVKSLFGLKGIGAASSLGFYTYLFSWEMAVSLVVFLFIHEYGHLRAMKECGLKTSGIYLIPGAGAVALADEDFKTAHNEMYIAIMLSLIHI